jgi:hypothetical protein
VGPYAVIGAGSRLEMSASLYPARGDGGAITRASAAGASDGLFDIVDRVTAQLAVAQGAPAGERLAQLAAVTTPSLVALKAYLEAQNAYRANDLYAAIPAYQRAVAADSSFALAWYGLASAASWMLQPRLEQEAAEHAVRHGAPQRVDVELEYGKSQVSVRVNDDGRGFDTRIVEKKTGHYGVISMRERAAQVRGKLTIASQPGKGTRVEAIVPVG